MRKTPVTSAEKRRIAEIRQAVAAYMQSEGCSCCRGSDHDQNAAHLAYLLNVPKYSDGSGYDFPRFRKRFTPAAIQPEGKAG